MKIYYLAVFASTILSGTASANDEITVEALRLPARAGETGSSVSVITADEIELKAYQFALDAIASAPGVTVNQTGALGGLATVRIRGASTGQTLVLLDGVPLGDPTAVGGGYDFSILDPADIERIEILKGPHSTLWGSDAIGGVVSIITKRPEDGAGARVFAEAGSYKTYRGGASLFVGGERGDLLLSASGISSDGISKADARDGNGEADGYEGLTFSGRGGLNLSEVRIEALARVQSGETEIDGFPPPGFTLADSDDSSKTEQATASLRALVPTLRGALRHEVFAGYTDITRKGSYDGYNTTDKGDRLILRYQGTASISSALRLAGGAEREETKANGDMVSINSLFALAETKLFSRLTLSAGLRYDDHSTFGDVTTARAGGSFSMSDHLTLRGSWGEGFKAPTIFQLTQSFGALPPNGDLQPETSSAWDIGADIGFFDDRAALSLSWFQRQTKSEIIFAPNFRYENLQRTQARGIEAAFALNATERLRFDFNYAYIDAEDASTEERQIATPRHSGDASFSWRGAKLSGSFTLRYNGAEIAGPFTGNVDAWLRADLSGALKVNDRIELYGRIENLFDGNHQQVAGYGTPGISGYAGVRTKF